LIFNIRFFLRLRFGFFLGFFLFGRGYGFFGRWKLGFL